MSGAQALNAVPRWTINNGPSARPVRIVAPARIGAVSIAPCDIQIRKPSKKLRDWLSEHCKGDFKIYVPEDIKELRKWEKYLVRFELQEDRKKLALLIGIHWPKWLG